MEKRSRRRNRARRKGLSRGSNLNGYRRRTRSAGDNGQGLLSILLPLAAFGAVFYIVAFTSFGDRLTEKASGMMPAGCTSGTAILTSAPEGTDAPMSTSLAETLPSAVSTEDKNARSVKVALPRLSIYMLQMGVYSSEENALEQSQLLKNMGAAGYVYNDNGSYRVIAAAFEAEQDAKSVRDRLEKDGYAVTVFPVTCSGAELLITAEQDKLVPIETAFAYASDIIGLLDKSAVDFDAEVRSVEYALTVLKEMRINAVNCSAGIYDCAQTNELLLYLYNYLNDITGLIGELTDGEYERTEFSSAYKSLRIRAALRYDHLLKQICG